MNVTWNADEQRAEWAPGRGDYSAHYVDDMIVVIEEGNCAQGCVLSGTAKDRREFGPGGRCSILGRLVNEEVMPELEARPTGPHCLERVPPPPPEPRAPARRRPPAGMASLFGEPTAEVTG